MTKYVIGLFLLLAGCNYGAKGTKLESECFYDIGNNPNSIYLCRVVLNKGMHNTLVIVPAYYNLVDTEETPFVLILTPDKDNAIKFNAVDDSVLELRVSGLPSEVPSFLQYKE